MRRLPMFFQRMAVCLAVLAAVPAWSEPLDVPKLENVLGLKGTAKDGEFKVSIPQKELRVVVDGFSIIPPMGLTTWVAFTPHGTGVMAMGDVMLLEEEFKAVQKVAIDRGLTVTAIHNHFLRDKPKVMYMHVGGMGGAEKVAGDVRAVLDRVKALRAAKFAASVDAPTVKSDFDTKEIDAVIGKSGEMKDGVYKIVIGRPDVPLTDMGSAVTTFLGFNTWMAFQGTKEKAAVCGDFAMLENEVPGVIEQLVKHGIEVTAVHNHMVTEEPRIIFLHFWGVDTLGNLARGLKATLDQTGKGQ
jgi:hypothetical protein